MELNDILIIIGCVISIIIIGAVFKVSAFKILKLIFNSILGGILIFVINQIGANYGLHIGLNLCRLVWNTRSNIVITAKNILKKM